ncbi:MAG: EAL domain-containing protein [Kineosporiaceae bacterium]|nr:EAL domain-containing protein [Aeromicrobium sp.]
MLDRDYRFTYVNKRAASMFGASAKSMLGRNLWEAFPDVEVLVRSSYTTAMDDRVPVAFETYYPAPLEMWLEVRAQPSSEGIVVYFQNITERRTRTEERESLLKSEQAARAEAHEALREVELARRKLAHLATHDSLTGLVNRGEFERIAAAHLARRVSHQPSVTILFLDLDRFKLVNDSLGHAVGDALLVECAARIVHTVGSKGVSARLGGDEFVVLVEDLSTELIQSLCERLLHEIRKPALIGEYTISTSTSIGLATTAGAEEPATLLKNADIALYRAKKEGRDRFAWFDADAHRSLLERISLETELRIALDAGSIAVHYQPIFLLADDSVCGVEALARWEHPGRGSISPSTFISLAEDAGLINRLGRQVAQIAIAQAMQWLTIPNFKVWINISGRQFTTSRIADDLLGDLADVGLSPHRLGVEVTETVLADEIVAVRALQKLAAAGVGIAIDDFGTGYSSIARLSTLPVSVLKIDRSFVSDIDNPRGRATLDAIIQLAEAFDMRTVAEGVETARQLELIREAGVTCASGYLLAPPAPANALVHQLPRLIIEDPEPRLSS